MNEPLKTAVYECTSEPRTEKTSVIHVTDKRITSRIAKHS